MGFILGFRSRVEGIEAMIGGPDIGRTFHLFPTGVKELLSH
jgi:hypothetical protein